MCEVTIAQVIACRSARINLVQRHDLLVTLRKQLQPLESYVITSFTIYIYNIKVIIHRPAYQHCYLANGLTVDLVGFHYVYYTCRVQRACQRIYVMHGCMPLHESLKDSYR